MLADETGDYEVVVRTPNTMRFWINADPRAAADVSLDVNVSNPSQPDHRVTVRLLGGRRYPIGIDYWALPEKEGAAAPAIALRWKPPRGAERPIPARNLSPRLASPTLVIGTRFPPARRPRSAFKLWLRYAKPSMGLIEVDAGAAGAPAASVPVGFTQAGLPVGMQLAAARWRDDLVLRAAHAYQQVTDWHLRRAPL